MIATWDYLFREYCFVVRNRIQVIAQGRYDRQHLGLRPRETGSFAAVARSREYDA